MKRLRSLLRGFVELPSCNDVDMLMLVLIETRLQPIVFGGCAFADLYHPAFCPVHN